MRKCGPSLGRISNVPAIRKYSCCFRPAADETGLVEKHPAPLQIANFFVAQSAVEGEHERRIDRPRPLDPRRLDQAVLLIGETCAAHLFVFGQPELLPPFQARANEVALILEKPEKKTDLLVIDFGDARSFNRAV